ncbi:choice-of-anchor M domain-containing protein [Amycolatopsis jiangsuensis]|uniref:Surface-anchored protein n=1 Tax=Amycolatopsis jiangsuensis TaxID=1181879 RepID=A0A840J2J8_9PSEU|nr:choice-of-anchor M domain-containing protein [Amycolatopsis jiangsuensis]MBB4689256.1 surface-anchored protein [Amycolatopsis jiangsuensis]
MHHPKPRRRRTRAAALFAGVAGATILLAPVPAAAFEPDGGREVVGAGAHVDAIYPEVRDGKLAVHSLTPDGVREPEELVLHVPETDSSHVKLPAGFDFLGQEGSDAWVTTEAQDQSVVWPGWSFEGIERGLLKGTVKIDYTGYGYAGDATDPRFAVTQPGGFDHTKVSQLFVPGSPFTTVSGEVGAHTHATWTFTAKGTYDIAFKVSASLADGTPVSDDATVRFQVGDLPDTPADPVKRADPPAGASLDHLTVVPNKVDGEYFVGQTVTLTAMSPAGATPGSSYRWYTTKPGGGPVPDEEQKTATYTDKPTRALDGTTVHVEQVGADGKVLDKSEPQTIRVRALPPTTTLTVTPDQETYPVGATASFSSVQKPSTADEHYHWYLRKPGEDSYEWIEESRLADQKLPITADLDGAEITARLFNADHAILSEAAPLRISVSGAPAANLRVTSAKPTYAPGETAKFTATGAAPDSVIDWSVRKNGENEYTALDDGHGATLSRPVDAGWQGSQVRAVVRDGSGEQSVEAMAPVVHVEDTPAASEEDTSNGVPVWLVVGGVVIVVVLIGGGVFFARSRRKSDA